MKCGKVDVPLFAIRKSQLFLREVNIVHYVKSVKKISPCSYRINIYKTNLTHSEYISTQKLTPLVQ